MTKELKLLGVAVAALAAGWWWTSPPYSRQVSHQIDRWQRPGARAAVEAWLRAQGPRVLEPLVEQLKIGTRPRRMAIRGLLLVAIQRPAWQPEAWRLLRRALENPDWRVREVSLDLLLTTPYRRAEHLSLLAAALKDAHPYIRYLAVEHLRKKGPEAAALLGGLQRLLSTGLSGAKDDGHHHGSHGHAHEPASTSPSQLKEHLRTRALCQVDRDDDWPARREILRSLPRLKLSARRQVELYFASLKDRHEAVVKAARQGLVRLGARALPALRRELLDIAEHRFRAARAMAWLGDPAAPVLLRAFLHRDPSVWHAAAQGLRSLGAKRGPTHASPAQGVVEGLCLLTQDPARAASAFAILASIGVGARSCLLASMRRPPQQALALRTIGRIAAGLCPSSKRRCAQWLRDFGPWLFHLAQHPTPATAALESVSWWALGQFGPAARRYAQDALSLGLDAALSSRRPELERARLLALYRIWPQLRRSSAFQRAWRRKGLGAPALVALLLEWRKGPVGCVAGASQLGHRHDKVRDAAVALLSMCQGALPLSSLLDRATQGPVAGRVAALQVLARWKGRPSQVASRLTKIALSPSAQASAQDAAAHALRAWVQPSLPAASWRALLRHPRWQVRRSALLALAQLRRRASAFVPLLQQALGDPKRQVRRAAARSLGVVGKSAAVAEAALKRAMADQSIDVQRAAKHALALIRLDQKGLVHRPPSGRRAP